MHFNFFTLFLLDTYNSRESQVTLLLKQRKNNDILNEGERIQSYEKYNLGEKILIMILNY